MTDAWLLVLARVGGRASEPAKFWEPGGQTDERMGCSRGAGRSGNVLATARTRSVRAIVLVVLLGWR